MALKEKKSEKEIGLGKIFLIVFMVFIMVPILILGAIYYTNENAKMEMNKYLSKFPGKIGEYFKTYPTKEELNYQIESIAKYLVQIDSNRAIDKLILIKNKDETIYNNIIKSMFKFDSTKTKDILENIRKNSIKTNILISTLQQIENEKESEIENQAKFYESLSTITAINKINSSLNTKSLTYYNLSKIFESMKMEKAVNLLRYLDPDIQSKILNNFASSQNKYEIETKLSTLKDKEIKLKNLANIYSIENPTNLIKTIGNTDTYNMEELTVIYRNIGVLKSAQILSYIENDDFVFELINNIKEKEILINGEDFLTSDILKGIKIYKQFNNNIKELTAIYEKMNENKIAELIKRMLRNGSEPIKYTLDNGQVVSFTDEDIALSILKNFSQRKVATILSYLDNNLSSEISKKLAMPNP